MDWSKRFRPGYEVLHNVTDEAAGPARDCLGTRGTSTPTHINEVV